MDSAASPPRIELTYNGCGARTGAPCCAREGKTGNKATPARKAASSPKGGENAKASREARTLGKKLGLAVTSTKGEDGQRSYSIKG